MNLRKFNICFIVLLAVACAQVSQKVSETSVETMDSEKQLLTGKNALHRDSVTAFILRFHQDMFSISANHTQTDDACMLLTSTAQDASGMDFKQYLDLQSANIDKVDGKFSQEISLAEPIKITQEKGQLNFRMHSNQFLLVDSVVRITRMLVTSGSVSSSEGRLQISKFSVLENYDLQ